MTSIIIILIITAVVIVNYRDDIMIKVIHTHHYNYTKKKIATCKQQLLQ